MPFLFGVFLIMFFGAFNVLFVGDDYGGAKQQGLPVIQFMLLSSGAVSLGVILSNKAARALLLRSQALLYLCALALISAAWCPDPSYAVRKAMSLTFIALTAIAMVGRLGTTASVRVLLISMAVTCAMSIAAVFLAPETGVHQDTDKFQSVHAGLWRGVLAHKVSLGMFAGLTLALALTCPSQVLGLPARAGIAAMALACLIGSGSATGIAAAALFIILNWAAHALTRQPQQMRRRLIIAFSLLLAGLAIGMFTGTFDRWATLLGRSGNLTGRANYWPHVLNLVNGQAPVIGFGYAGGYRSIMHIINATAGSRLTEAHNGLIELLVAFGYLGTTIVMGIIALLYWRACQLLVNAPVNVRALTVFPTVALATNFLVSYVESIILMPSGFWTVVFFLAVAMVAKFEITTGSVQADRRNMMLRPAPKGAMQPAIRDGGSVMADEPRPVQWR